MSETSATLSERPTDHRHKTDTSENLVYFNEVDKGGHFAAWEEPDLFSEELRGAFASVR